MRSHVLGGAASSSSRGNAPATNHDATNTGELKTRRVAKQKSVKEAADALLKKAAVKSDEGEGIGSLLRRSGVHLGLHMSWSSGHARFELALENMFVWVMI